MKYAETLTSSGNTSSIARRAAAAALVAVLVTGCGSRGDKPGPGSEGGNSPKSWPVPTCNEIPGKDNAARLTLVHGVDRQEIAHMLGKYGQAPKVAAWREARDYFDSFVQENGLSGHRDRFTVGAEVVPGGTLSPEQARDDARRLQVIGSRVLALEQNPEPESLGMSGVITPGKGALYIEATIPGAAAKPSDPCALM